MFDIAPDGPAVPTGAVVPELVPSAPLTFGFETEEGLVVSAPAGALVAGVGADADAFGEGGDWVEPDCAKAGAAARIKANADAYFNMIDGSLLVVAYPTRPSRQG